MTSRGVLIVTAMVVGSVSLSVSASYFLFGRRAPAVRYDDSRLVQRIGSAEARIASLGKTGAKHIDADLQFMQSVVSSGVLDARWWCWEFDCTRDQVTCNASIAGAVAKARSLGVDSTKYERGICKEQTLAFCNSTRCYPTLKGCSDVSPLERCAGLE